MEEHPNLGAARAGYEAFAAGDMAAVSDLLTDDIVWHVAGNYDMSGDYAGKEAVFGFFAKLMEESRGTFRIDIHDMLANDDHGVALGTVSATRGEDTLEDRVTQVFHMRDGRMTEFWTFAEHQDQHDAFWP